MEPIKTTSKMTRFAPSPTGFLHLGHIASAIYVWGIAQQRNAKVILRIEDHDRIRCRPEYEESIYKDLEWLGLAPDDGPSGLNKASKYRQSDCEELYARELQKLSQQHHVYRCNCSRKQIRSMMPSESQGKELLYMGTCREKNIKEGGGIRIQIDDSSIGFEDLYLGFREQSPAQQCGDILIQDRDQNWTYQFAATVDDFNQGIDLVVRGQDLTESTGRQILLGQMLDRGNPARFFHHPLLLNNNGEKLSKRQFDEGVCIYRADGVKGETILGRAAFHLGLIPHEKPINVRDLGDLLEEKRA